VPIAESYRGVMPFLASDVICAAVAAAFRPSRCGWCSTWGRDTDYANLRKLIAGRLDAFILDEKTGIRALEANGLTQQVQYDAKRPVFRQEVYYAFQNNAEGKALAERFSVALERLKRDGRYQKITRGITFANGCPK
jgi:ABC-type amino acid transport substrate-binding protein